MLLFGPDGNSRIKRKIGFLKDYHAVELPICLPEEYNVTDAISSGPCFDGEDDEFDGEDSEDDEVWIFEAEESDEDTGL